VAGQRGATVSISLASSLPMPPLMYSMPCVMWIGGLTAACAEESAARRTAPQSAAAAAGRVRNEIRVVMV